MAADTAGCDDETGTLLVSPENPQATNRSICPGPQIGS